MFILQISCQPSIKFSNSFFLLKTEIHTQILNTKPFLCNFREPRYLPNKIDFLTRAIVINSFFYNFHLSGILIDDKNEHKFKQIYPVGTTFVISGYLGGLSVPVRGYSEVSMLAWGQCDVFRTTTDKHKDNFLRFKTPFCFDNISTP